MIIAPNRFFLDYISSILPDLGVNDVKQYTFEDFAYDVIGKKLKIPDSNEKLVQIVNNMIDGKYKEKIDIVLKESKFKSSIKFKIYIDRYLKEVEQKYIPKENFEYNGYNIMNYKDINELFLKTYSNYNFKNRINEIEKHLATEFRKKSKEIIENLKNQRTRAIENLQGEKRIQVFEQYAKEIEMVEKKYMKIIKEYLNKIQNKDCIEYYKDFLENYFMQYTFVHIKYQVQ